VKRHVKLNRHIISESVPTLFAKSPNLPMFVETTACLKLARFYPCNALLAVFATATWLAGWTSVTHRYCVKTAKPILKLFQPSGSSSTPSFLTPCTSTQFQGEPCHIPPKLPQNMHEYAISIQKTQI